MQILDLHISSDSVLPSFDWFYLVKQGYPVDRQSVKLQIDFFHLLCQFIPIQYLVLPSFMLFSRDTLSEDERGS